MKTVFNTTIEETLSGTEFEDLIPKFKSAGEKNLRRLTILNNQGKLLDYLKEFESDSDKRLRLHKHIKEQLIKASKSMLKLIGLCVIIFITINIVVIKAFSGDSSNSESRSIIRESNTSKTLSESNTSKKCSDMDSYDFGYSVARDQQGLAVDCDYLYDMAKTQRTISSKSCFCQGVSDFQSNR